MVHDPQWDTGDLALSQMESLNVPGTIVQDILKEINPRGTELRKKHRLRR